ncbi:hypothetical protein ACK3TF_001263 [Chlorella vulgaris]
MTAALASLGLSSARCPSRHKFCCARPAAAAHWPGKASRRLVVSASKHISEADMYQAVAPPQGPPPSSGPPLYVAVPLAFVGVIAALRIAKMVKKNSAKSSRLEERGFKKGGIADDKAYTSAIKGMRKIQYEELSDEQIAEARRRRQREVERDMAPMDIDNIELPDNHPFAVKKKLAPEEEAVQRSRFSARRGLSQDDLQSLKEQQALADQMEAEQEERLAARKRRAESQ